MKENELKIFSVTVDAEGNDKWSADGIFVDKPKLKTEVKPEGVNARPLEGILNCTGLTKEGILIVDLQCNTISHSVTEVLVRYYDTRTDNGTSTKTIQIYNH